MLLIGLIVLLLAGTAMVYSASRRRPSIERTPRIRPSPRWPESFCWFIGLVDYTLLKNLSYAIYGIVVVSLVAVLLVGAERFGARRWFELGGFDVQPGEVAKLLLGIVLAKFVADRQGKRPYFETVILSLLIVPCIVLILRQPNLSSAVIIVFMWLAIIFVGGIERQHVLIIAMTAVPWCFWSCNSA